MSQHKECPKCGSSGFLNAGDLVPYGSTWVTAPCWEPCSCWTSVNDPRCPACGQEMLRFTEDESDAICERCGWKSDPGRSY